MDTIEEFITLKDAARLCAVEESAVREWVRRGRLNGWSEGGGLRVRLDEVLSLPESRAATEAALNEGSEFYRLRREGLMKRAEFAEILKELASRPPRDS